MVVTLSCKLANLCTYIQDNLSMFWQSITMETSQILHFHQSLSFHKIIHTLVTKKTK